MTGQVVPCGSNTSSLLNTTRNLSTLSSSSSPAQPTLSPSSSASSILLIPNLVWSETISMDDHHYQQHQQHLKKVTLVPDPLAASVAAAAAVATATSTTNSSTTTSSQSDRIASEGYSSASSHDNLPIVNNVSSRSLLTSSTALVSSTTAAASAAAESSTTAYATLSASTTNNNTVAEFLYQLTKMLSDDNRDVIEWSNGKIEVHSPQKLELQVLHKYFRHSKFASFQRQLNYFGFRKLAGKGKMAPCSYVNDDTTQELRSLLLIKRKASLTQSGKEKTKRKRDRSNSGFGSQGSTGNASNSNNNNSMVNPVLAGILQRSSTLPLPTAVMTAPVLSTTVPSTVSSIPPVSNRTHPLKGSLIQDPLAPTSSSGLHNMMNTMTPQALAQAAVGKGIKHNLRAPIPAPIVPLPLPTAAAVTDTSSTAVTTILPSSTVPNVANVAMLTSKAPPQPQPNAAKGELLFLPDTQISHSIQESLSQLTNNFKNSLNELREQGDNSNSGGESEQDVTRSMSPGGVGLFMLSRNSSLVDLAMLDVQNEDDDDDGAGDNDNNRYLMPFVDFPHQDLIPSDQQQQQQQQSASSSQSHTSSQQQQQQNMSASQCHQASS